MSFCLVRNLILSLPLLILVTKLDASLEPIGGVVAVVGNVPITDLDLERETGYFTRRKGIKKNRKRDIKSQVLDLLISRAIIDFVAKQEEIAVSPKRIKAAIKKEMNLRKIKSEAVFKQKVERELKIKYTEYKKELARQIKTQQVMQLRVEVPNPTPSQIEAWYNLNKRKRIPQKYTIRLITKRFNRSNELQVSRTMRTAQKEARRNFALAAKKYSDHPSKYRGGLIGSRDPFELAKISELVARVTMTTRTGRISQIVRDARTSRYYFIKVENVRKIPLSELYERIRIILYEQNKQVAFEKWVKDQRKRIAVNIYLKGYADP